MDLDDQELEATRNNFYYLHVIKKYLEEMKVMIDIDCWFEINAENSKEFYNAINKLVKENEKLKNEIEEKTTIIMVGAEKVKQLEKEIEELKKENNEIWTHLPRLD